MANLNRVFLIGRLTRDPELRYVPSGAAVANLGIAVNRVYTTKEGEKREETCFVTVVVWRKQAEICGEYLSKGSAVFVEGRLQSRNWETSNGDKRSVLEVVASRIQFLDRKGSRPTPDSGENGMRIESSSPVGEEISEEGREIVQEEKESTT